MSAHAGWWRFDDQYLFWYDLRYSIVYQQLVDGVQIADVKRFFLFGGSDRGEEIVIDIAAVWERKLAATRCHVSQFGQREEALEWLARWNHEIGECCGLNYAEAFHQMQVW